MYAQKLCGGSFMEWVSMADQLHASLTSTSPMPSVGCSGVKHTDTVDCGAVETCSVEWRITLPCLAVRWASLGLVDAGRTLPAWLHCANCEVWWRGDNGMGLFFRVWARPLISSEGQSTYRDMFWWVWCGRTWLAYTALTSTPSSTFGMNWNGDWEPGLLVQHQGLTP